MGWLRIMAMAMAMATNYESMRVELDVQILQIPGVGNPIPM